MAEWNIFSRNYMEYAGLSLAYGPESTAARLVAATKSLDTHAAGDLLTMWASSLRRSPEITQAHALLSRKPGLHSYTIQGYGQVLVDNEPSTVSLFTHVNMFSSARGLTVVLAQTKLRLPGIIDTQPELMKSFRFNANGPVARSVNVMFHNIQALTTNPDCLTFFASVLEATPSLKTCTDMQQLSPLYGSLFGNENGSLFAVCPSWQGARPFDPRRRDTFGKFKSNALYSHEIPRLATPGGWSMLDTKKLGVNAVVSAVVNNNLKLLVKATATPLSHARLPSDSWHWSSPILLAEFSRQLLHDRTDRSC